MKNTIVLEVKEVFLSDFNDNVSAPALVESMEGGVRILFNDIDELKKYQEKLLSMQDLEEVNIQNNEVITKLNLSLNRELLDNQVVLDSIKAFAEALFSFVFNAEGHRQDKIAIYDTMVEEIRETTNSWELDKALTDSTYELGILTLDHRLTFYTFAHNHVHFDYEKIKNRLVKDLLILRLGLN